MRKEIAIFIVTKDVSDNFIEPTEEEKQELIQLLRNGFMISPDDEDYNIQLIHTIV